MRQTANTPCSVCRAMMDVKMAAMAPVGPDIWKDAPDSVLMASPAMMAVMRPAAAPAPLLTPNASASGSATAATVRPAMTSFKKRFVL